ncbi:MAG TPA: hypothetical protein VKX46_04660 [Ktedonobacteraceae bacterium]|nr:hypothetical protein [Ktedonobacteraceae bacterium]
MAATLSLQEKERFYRIWFTLLHWVNKRLHLVPPFPASSEALASIELEHAMRVRNALWANDRLLDRFITNNPARLSKEDIALVESWKYRLAGEFFILGENKDYTVVLANATPHMQAYGVLGLTDSLADTITIPPPVLVKAVLLPFEGRIIYDSLMAVPPTLLEPGMRSELKNAYRHAIKQKDIITSLLPLHPQHESPESKA